MRLDRSARNGAVDMRNGFFPAAVIAALLFATNDSARAHDIYTGVRGKTGLLCCGGSDCAATTSDILISRESELAPQTRA